MIAVAGVAFAVYADQPDEGDFDAPQGCRVETAEALDVEEISDVSPSGEYLLGEVDGDERLVREGEKPVELRAVLADAFGVRQDQVNIPYQSPLRVNSSGAVIGIADPPSNDDSQRQTDLTWLYHDGKVTKLELPAEYDPQEWDLRLDDLGDDGTVVGSAVKRPRHTQSDGVLATPLKWGPGSYQPTILDQAESVITYANAVNRDGTIVGADYQLAKEDTYPADPAKIVSWRPNGDRTELPFGDESFDGGFGKTPKVTGDWVLVGDHRWNLNGDDPPQRVRPSYDYPENEVEVDSHLFSSPALPIDAHGRVYGVDGKRPVMETDGKLRELPVEAKKSADAGLVVGAEYYASRPSAVSDDGSVIVGKNDYYGGYDDVVTESFLWRCAT